MKPQSECDGRELPEFCSLALRRPRPRTPPARRQPGPAWEEPLRFCSCRSFQNRCSSPASLPGRRLSCVCPPLRCLLSQAKADKAQKTQGPGAARKTSGFVCSSCPRPRRQPRGQIWACQEIHAQSLVNFGWDSGLGFSRGHVGGARDFVLEASLALGLLLGAGPFPLIARPWIPSCFYL